MKKHIIIYLVFVLVLACIFTGCGKTAAPAEQPDPGNNLSAPSWPPDLDIVFTSDDGTSISVPTVQTGTQWFYFDEEGNQRGVLADSPPPNQISFTDDITLYLNGSGGVAELHFSDVNFIPDTISARRLNASYLFTNQMNLHNDHNTAQENANKNYEPVLLNDKQLRIDNDGQDYIYVIDAKWDAVEGLLGDGHTTYCFRVNH